MNPGSALRALAAVLLLAVLPSIPVLPGPVASAAAAAPGPSPAFGVEGEPAWMKVNVPAANGAGEPTLGVAWNLTGGKRADGAPAVGTTAMFMARLSEFRVTFDDSRNPPVASVRDVTHPYTLPIGFDPILFTDPITGRTWAGELEVAGTAIAGPTVSVGGVVSTNVGCTNLAFTDDNGATWTPAADACSLPAWDHETIGSGPWAGGKPEPEVPGEEVYDSIVYYCSQYPRKVCWTSSDGGLTFGPSGEVDPASACGGLHGHIRVAADGTAYLPNHNCGGRTGFTVTTDNGATWSVRSVVAPGSGGGRLDFDPSVGIALEKAPATASSAPAVTSQRIYLGQAEADGAYIAVSDDRGLTWNQGVGSGNGAAPTTIYYNVLQAWNAAHPTEPPLRQAEFAEVIAGDWDRAAFAFLATHGTGDKNTCGTVHDWHMYTAFTYDGGVTWGVTRASPDLVQTDGIWAGGGTQPCRNLLDFNDIVIDVDGRVLVAYADGCTGSCDGTPPTNTGKPATHDDAGAILRQITGCGLLSSRDAAGGGCSAPTGTPAITITSPPTGAVLAPGLATVAGIVDRDPVGPQPLVAHAGGPYGGVEGAPIPIAASATGGTPPYACSWTGTGATFAAASSCATTVLFPTNGTRSISVTVTDGANATAAATATVTVAPAIPPPVCANDGTAGTAGAMPLAPPPYDITRVCIGPDGTGVQVTVTVADMTLDSALGCLESPVTYGIWFAGQGSPFEVGCSVGVVTANWNSDDPFGTAATASFDYASRSVTLRVPAAELVGADTPPAAHAETYTGPGSYGARPLWIPESITGLPLYLDRAPDADEVGLAPARTAPEGLPLSASAPATAAAGADAAGTAYYFHGSLPVGNGLDDFPLPMDDTAPTGSTPRVVVPLPLDGASRPNFIYDAAHWQTTEPVSLDQQDVTVTWWVAPGPKSGLESAVFAPTWEIVLFKDGVAFHTVEPATTGPAVPLAGPTEFTYTIPDVSMGVGALGVLIDPNFVDTADVPLLYDAAAFPSRIHLSAPTVLSADAGGPYTGTAGHPVAITASGAAGTPPYSCAWSGAGATFANPAACATTVTFASAGSKAIAVAVTDSATPPVTASDTATVLVQEPERVEIHDGPTFLGAVDVVSTPGGGAVPWSLNVTLSGSGPKTLLARWVDADGSPLATASVQVRLNAPPVLLLPGPQAAREGERLRFSVGATDADGDAVSLAAGTLPEGAAFDAAAGEFTWTPRHDQAGSYTVAFTASDGRGGTDTGAVAIAVEDVNRPPTLAVPGPQSGAEGSMLTFAVAASDPDGDPVAYSAIGLPAGATLDGATGQFTWTPGYDQAGSHTVTFVANDGRDGQTAGDVVIAVSNTDRAPVLDPLADVAARARTLIAFTVHAVDPDGDAVAYSAIGLPAGATLDPITGAFSWTPHPTQQGQHTVTFQATAGGATDSQDVLFTITRR